MPMHENLQPFTIQMPMHENLQLILLWPFPMHENLQLILALYCSDANAMSSPTKQGHCFDKLD
jgi:hypothetical protein